MTDAQRLWRATVMGDPLDATGYLILADALEEEGEDAAAVYIRDAAKWAKQQWDNRNCPMFMFSCGELLRDFPTLAREGCDRCSRYATASMQRVLSIRDAAYACSNEWKDRWTVEGPQ